MGELRKGQKAQIDVVVINGNPDVDGEVEVRMPPGSTLDLVYMPLAALRFGDAGPSYLARREAMVRAYAAGPLGERITSLSAARGGTLYMDTLVEMADETLRAIDETPAPEWAGGEHG